VSRGSGSLENPETIDRSLRAYQVFLIGGEHRVPPPVVVHPRGVVERHDWFVRRRRFGAEVSRVFVSSRSRLDFYARSVSEAGEADVRPKRGEPIGHSCKRRWSEKRASDGRARPETGASTAHDRLDRVPVPWTPCMFAVRHRSTRARSVTAEDSTSAPVGAARCVARKCSPRECDQCRPPRSARATCRATRRAVRPPTEHTTRTRSVRVARELTSRGRCPARRVLAPAPRQIDASAGHLSEGRRTSRKDRVGKIRPSFGGPRSRIPRANQNRDLRKIFIAGGSLSHEPRMIPTAKI
jgi:hypothetical protein